MPETPRDSTPTYFANIATVHVNVDEVSIEFRRVLIPHRDIWLRSERGTQSLPALSEEELYRTDPIVKIVLTFSGAKALSENLTALLMQIEPLRRTG